jgi:hypothetical protein
VSVQQKIISEGVDVVDTFEELLTELGLTYRRLSLKKYKECIHWHIQQPGVSGTLEATYVPNGKRLWLERRSGRDAAWQEKAVEDVLTILKPDTEAETP